MQNITEVMRLIDVMKKPLKNTLLMEKITDENESSRHLDLKYYSCKLLRKQGYTFFTEARLINKNIPDIFVPSLCCVFEIQVTEKDSSIERKKIDYSKIGIRVYVVKKEKDIETYLGIKNAM